MAKTKGFLEYQRREAGHRPVTERVRDFGEIDVPLAPEDLQCQAARCIDCGIPFCHGTGCPVKNRIPEFNDLVYRGRWREACVNLHSTNNFPEITGRVCPAPCEAACTLAINDDAVLIKHIEYQIVERGWSEGWIVPEPASEKTGRSVAVVGSGPAGLAAAQQLARAGHEVTVFEKDEKAGGLLRYGIPDFKLAKWVIDRRLGQMEAEGVRFETGMEVGKDLSGRYLRRRFDAVVLTMGAGQPRDLNVPGRGLDGVYFAMEFLGCQNRVLAGEALGPAGRIDARDKDVVVIGGGDTGSDCVGTARRQGARSITQLEILPQPPESRPPDTPWPYWPRILRTSTSHEEGCERMWGVMTQRLEGEGGRVKRLHGCRVEWHREDGQWRMEPVAGSEFTLAADLVLLAMGFVHVVHRGLVEELGLKLDARGNLVVEDYQTSEPWVFAAGDSVLGASLVVWAIDGGRCAAEAVDGWLKG